MKTLNEYGLHDIDAVSSALLAVNNSVTSELLTSLISKLDSSLLDAREACKELGLKVKQRDRPREYLTVLGLLKFDRSYYFDEINNKYTYPTDTFVGIPNCSDILILSHSIIDGAHLYTGWLLLLNLSIWRRLPVESKSPTPESVTIKAKTGTWFEALMVTIKDSSGTLVKLPLHLVKQKGTELTLGFDDIAEVEWWLSPEETKGLAEGAYTISIRFDPKLLADSVNQNAENY